MHPSVLGTLPLAVVVRIVPVVRVSVVVVVAAVLAATVAVAAVVVAAAAAAAITAVVVVVVAVNQADLRCTSALVLAVVAVSCLLAMLLSVLWSLHELLSLPLEVQRDVSL